MGKGSIAPPAIRPHKPTTACFDAVELSSSPVGHSGARRGTHGHTRLFQVTLQANSYRPRILDLPEKISVGNRQSRSLLPFLRINGIKANISGLRLVFKYLI